MPSGLEGLTGEDSEQGEGWLSRTGESAAASITASSDLYAWHYTSGEPGMYIVASRGLAQTYTNDQLVTTGLNDYSSSCEPGALQAFERSPFKGKMQEWKNCGGDEEASFLTIAAAPEDRECVIAAQIAMYSEEDAEVGEHILDTLQVDCGLIPTSAPANSSSEQAASPSSSGEQEASPNSSGEQVSCEGFVSAAGNPSQWQAQQFFDFIATPEQRSALDADGDGFACDSLETGEDKLDATQPSDGAVSSCARFGRETLSETRCGDYLNGDPAPTFEEMDAMCREMGKATAQSGACITPTSETARTPQR